MHLIGRRYPYCYWACTYAVSRLSCWYLQGCTHYALSLTQRGRRSFVHDTIVCKSRITALPRKRIVSQQGANFSWSSINPFDGKICRQCSLPLHFNECEKLTRIYSLFSFYKFLLFFSFRPHLNFRFRNQKQELALPTIQEIPWWKFWIGIHDEPIRNLFQANANQFKQIRKKFWNSWKSLSELNF